MPMADSSSPCRVVDVAGGGYCGGGCDDVNGAAVTSSSDGAPES